MPAAAATSSCRRSGQFSVLYSCFFLLAAMLPRSIGYVLRVSGNELVRGNLSTFVTDMFHGSICALKIGSVAPIFIESRRKWAKINSKDRDLYGDLNLFEWVSRVDEPDWLDRLIGLAYEWKPMPRVEIGQANAYFASVRQAL